MFDFQHYNAAYLAEPGTNDATTYGVYVNRATADRKFRCVGIHHLTPDENQGNHHVFLEVLDAAGNRLRSVRVAWTWDGRLPHQPADPVRLDKPDSEPAANIGLGMGQKASVWIEGEESDVVTNLHTKHPNEAPGNTMGHHSFYVVFQLIEPGQDPTPEDDLNHRVQQARLLLTQALDLLKT